MEEYKYEPGAIEIEYKKLIVQKKITTKLVANWLYAYIYLKKRRSE